MEFAVGEEDGVMIREITDADTKAEICGRILADLPEWFGIPESVREYVDGCRQRPFWASSHDGIWNGFIALKETSRWTAEIYVMGIKKEFHRKGMGRALFKKLYAYAEKQGYMYLQVKTVQEGYYECYDRTNRFYRSLGFRELECFPELWSPKNPCQIYVMAILREALPGMR